MRILFIGNVLFSYDLLKVALKNKANIIGVITTKKSKFNSDYVDLTSLCKKKKIDIHYTKKINSTKSVKWIKKKSPDYIFCFGWSQILNDKIISIPKKCIIGFHPSKLPMFRGRHPIIWSIILGANEIASSFFIINKNIDDGPIVSQKTLKIKKNNDSFDIYKKITKKAKSQLVDIIKKIKDDKLKIIINNEDKSSSLRKRSFEDGKIDWRMSALSISRLVRALNYPYPGAHLQYKNKIYKIWKVKIIQDKKMIEPGKILSNKINTPTIKCADFAIKIISSTPRIDLRGAKYL